MCKTFFFSRYYRNVGTDYKLYAINENSRISVFLLRTILTVDRSYGYPIRRFDVRGEAVVLATKRSVVTILLHIRYSTWYIVIAFIYTKRVKTIWHPYYISIFMYKLNFTVKKMNNLYFEPGTVLTIYKVPHLQVCLRQ